MDEILLEVNKYYASSESLYDGIIEDACNKGLTCLIPDNYFCLNLAQKKELAYKIFDQVYI